MIHPNLSRLTSQRAIQFMLLVAVFWSVGTAVLLASPAFFPGAVAQAAGNPCNPCAAKANPCGAKANPCAGKTGANPCNPCAAKANPCAANPCAAKANPCAAKKSW